jgi:hypothetical protein
MHQELQSMIKNNKESDLSLSLMIYGFLAVMVFAPVIAVYDVITHKRNLTGIRNNLSDLPIIYELGHIAYITCALIAIACFIIFFKSLLKQKKTSPQTQLTGKQRIGHSVITLFSALYMLPFFWLLVYVPGYWKALFIFIKDVIWDAIF